MSTLLFCSVNITFGILLVSLIFALTRLIKGPSTPDRVVALDLITNISMGMVVLYLILHHESVFVDTVGIVALISYLGTIAYAVHIEKGATS